MECSGCSLRAAVVSTRVLSNDSLEAQLVAQLSSYEQRHHHPDLLRHFAVADTTLGGVTVFQMDPKASRFRVDLSTFQSVAPRHRMIPNDDITFIS